MSRETSDQSTPLTTAPDEIRYNRTQPIVVNSMLQHDSATPTAATAATISRVPVQHTAPSAEELSRSSSLAHEQVVLRLRHISKSYPIKHSNERVEALKDITLCEEDNDNASESNETRQNQQQEVEEDQETPQSLLSSQNQDQKQMQLHEQEYNGYDERHSSTETNQKGFPAMLPPLKPNSSNSNNESSSHTKSNHTIRHFGPVRRGEFVMIRGPSGGGKTTLLNIIGLIDSCTSGTIEIGDEVITKKTRESHLANIRLRTLGFVFQTFNLISTMTAAENVELPMTLLGKMSDRQIRLRARQLLTLVGLRNRVNHLPSELSGGEQQRVTIARSLANNPAILLLDEPTGDLDTINTIEIMDLLLRINRFTKTTCIMVTHNPDVECYADRVLYVSDGQFVRQVVNAHPTRLDPVKYAEYLSEKEKESTSLAVRLPLNDLLDEEAERQETLVPQE